MKLTEGFITKKIVPALMPNHRDFPPPTIVA